MSVEPELAVAWGPGSRRRFWVGLLVFGAVALLAGRQMVLSERAAAERWLARAVSAPARHDYHGTQRLTFQYAGEPREATITVVHSAPDRTWQKYSGGGLDGLVSVRKEGESWSADPFRGEVMQVTSRTVALPSGLPPASLDGYRVRVGPGEPVAGRKTRRVRVSGGGQERVWWIDRETGLVLRRRDRADGQLVSDLVFTEFALGRGPEQISFAAPGVPGTPVPLQTMPLPPHDWAARLGFEPARPAYLPPGYRQTGTYIYRCQCCPEPAGQVTYSDGVATFSLFQIPASQPCCQPAGAACAGHGDCLMVAAGQGGAAVREIGGLLYLALGTAPAGELVKVVESL